MSFKVRMQYLRAMLRRLPRPFHAFHDFSCSFRHNFNDTPTFVTILLLRGVNETLSVLYYFLTIEHKFIRITV